MIDITATTRPTRLHLPAGESVAGLGAVVHLWGGVAIVGVVLVVLTLMVVLVDAWANRPIKKPEPRRIDQALNRHPPA